MDFLKSISIAASGMQAQSGRMRIIAENLANAESTGRQPGADPYQRHIPTFESHFNRELRANTVALGKMEFDKTPFPEKYDPGHPAANEAGYVKMPNVNSLIEVADMREAQRSYEANLNVVTSTRTMMTRTLDILRG
jgi:flagellar basal-body rod protein FlgC